MLFLFLYRLYLHILHPGVQLGVHEEYIAQHLLADSILFGEKVQFWICAHYIFLNGVHQLQVPEIPAGKLMCVVDKLTC